jgi:ABC-type Fe3+ transport system permease subunit
MAPAPKPARWMTVVGVIVVAMTLTSLLLMAALKVAGGQGEETYRNYRGALIHYSSVVVVFGVAILAAIGSGVYAWWYRRRERIAEKLLEPQGKDKS